MRKFPPTVFKTAMVATAAFALSACSLTIGDDEEDAKPTEGETVTGENFDSIALAGPDDVVVVTGETPGWTVEGDAETVEKLRISVKDGVLKIRRTNNVLEWGTGDGKATVRVTMPALREFSLAGSGNGDVAEMIGDKGEISIAGSGAVSVGKVELSRLEIDIAGSGSAALAGTSEKLEISIAGSGDVLGEELSANQAEVSIAGSGDAKFASDGEVEASVAGSGDIVVTGDAKCTSKSLGSGEIDCG
ncbi:MAG: head GIN domain-containing protein [Pseudomonadota bacterium]